MITYSDWLSHFRRFTGLTQTEALNIGTTWLNQGRVIVIKSLNEYITEQKWLANTVAGQADYALPVRGYKVSNIAVLVGGTIKYSPKEITDPLVWNRITVVTTPQSTFPDVYFVDKDRLSLFPVPAASGNQIQAIFTMDEPDLTQIDVTAGTIALTNGSATVTGTTTNFLPSYVGWSMLLPDGNWYNVQSVASATSLTLTKLYEGSTTASATYRLGQISIIPDEGQLLPVYYASMQHYTSVGDLSRKSQFEELFYGIDGGSAGLKGLIRAYKTKTTTQLTTGSEATFTRYPRDPNLFPMNIPYTP
jgi:hypothetical protein